MTIEDKRNWLAELCKNQPSCLDCPLCGDCRSTASVEWLELPDDITEKAYAKASSAAKYDQGKPRISLVPTQIIRDIAAVREYGTNKYGSAENWKNVEEQRYIDALLRHTLAYMDDPHGTDAESGLPHLSHIACNVAFLCEMRRNRHA